MRKYFFNILLLFLFFCFINSCIEKFFCIDTDKYYTFLEKIQINFSHLLNKGGDISRPADFDNYVEPYSVKKLLFNEENILKFCGEQRYSFGEKYKKNPIILFGCSYSYGHGLRKEETFPFYLSKITERPVLNFSGCGSEIISSYQNFLKYKEFNIPQTLIKNSDYIIYIYMFDHVNRLIHIRYFYNKYNDIFEPSGLEKSLSKIPLFRYLLAAYRLQKVFQKYPNSKEAARIMKKVIILYFKNSERYAPNAKKIIILYDEKIPDFYSVADIIYLHELMNSPIWKEIEKETDIKVLHSKDITGFLFDKHYKIEKDIAGWHPNARAWQVFTPKFAKEYIK